MSLYIGSGYFPASISSDRIKNILQSDPTTPPEMTLWEKIKEFFCSNHHAEALECIHQICHPPLGTTLFDVKKTFERLNKLAYPGYAGNIGTGRHESRHFHIMDKDGKAILSVVVADDHIVTMGWDPELTYGYRLHYFFPGVRGIVSGRYG